jgi:hypothetical protein
MPDYDASLPLSAAASAARRQQRSGRPGGPAVPRS